MPPGRGRRQRRRVNFEEAHKMLAEAYGWGPDIVGALTPVQLYGYTRTTPGTPRARGSKTIKVGSRAEAMRLCRELRGE